MSQHLVLGADRPQACFSRERPGMRSLRPGPPALPGQFSRPSTPISPLLWRSAALRRPAAARPTAGAAPARASGPQRAAALRALLARPGLLLGPAVYDGISARLTEQAGFDFAFMSGFSVAGARLALPDTGLLSFEEVLAQGRCMVEATQAIPLIADADTGYGNAMNVKRTVRQVAAAGFAGVLIEDQVWPKSCGHVRGKRVVPRDEAVARVRAACDARDELPVDTWEQRIVVVARTDARQAASFGEALARAVAFADAGADVVFVDALESAAEMRTLCAEVSGAAKMANMLEGGGKTPILTPEELQAMGFKLCAYPLSMLGVSINAMRAALAGLKDGRVPVAPAMPSFQELQAAVGFPEYFEEEARYAVPGSGAPEGATAGSSPAPPPAASAPSSSSSPPPPASSAVEADRVIEPGASVRSMEVLSSADYSGSSSGGGGGASDAAGAGMADRRAQFVRIRVSSVATGAVELDTRFPAGFLGPVAALVPAVAGVDLEALVRGEGPGGRARRPGEPVFEFETDGDRVQIFLEDGY